MSAISKTIGELKARISRLESDRRAGADLIDKISAELAAANARADEAAARSNANYNRWINDTEEGDARETAHRCHLEQTRVELAAARGTLVAVRKYLPQPSNRCRTELHGIIEEIDALTKGDGE